MTTIWADRPRLTIVVAFVFITLILTISAVTASLAGESTPRDAVIGLLCVGAGLLLLFRSGRSSLAVGVALVACVAVLASSIARLLQGDWSFVAIASGLLAADAGKDLVSLWRLPPADSTASEPAPEGVVTTSQPNVQVVRVGGDPAGARVSLIGPAPDPELSIQPPNPRAG